MLRSVTSQTPRLGEMDYGVHIGYYEAARTSMACFHIIVTDNTKDRTTTQKAGIATRKC